MLTGFEKSQSVHTPTAMELQWKNTSKHTSNAAQQGAGEAAGTAPRLVVQGLPTIRVMVQPRHQLPPSAANSCSNSNRNPKAKSTKPHESA